MDDHQDDRLDDRLEERSDDHQEHRLKALSKDRLENRMDDRLKERPEGHSNNHQKNRPQDLPEDGLDDHQDDRLEDRPEEESNEDSERPCKKRRIMSSAKARMRLLNGFLLPTGITNWGDKYKLTSPNTPGFSRTLDYVRAVLLPLCDSRPQIRRLKWQLMLLCRQAFVIGMTLSRLGPQYAFVCLGTDTTVCGKAELYKVSDSWGEKYRMRQRYVDGLQPEI